MKFVFAILIVAFVIAIFIAMALAYDWMRRKTIKSHIGGLEYFLYKFLKRGDYVSINGRVLCFSHLTQVGETIDHIKPPSNSNKTFGGELAFDNPNSLGHLIYPVSALRKCEFIYGKYGLKWAVSKEWATVAKEKINEYIWN